MQHYIHSVKSNTAKNFKVYSLGIDFHAIQLYKNGTRNHEKEKQFSATSNGGKCGAGRGSSQDINF